MQRDPVPAERPLDVLGGLDGVLEVVRGGEEEQDEDVHAAEDQNRQNVRI